MLEIGLEPAKSILLFKAVGLVSAGDYVGCMPDFKALVAKVRPRRLLCDWTELTGWDEEAESIRFFARLELRSEIERVAILADEAWYSEVSRLQEVVGIPSRSFRPPDRELALAWLGSNT